MTLTYVSKIANANEKHKKHRLSISPLLGIDSVILSSYALAVYEWKTRKHVLTHIIKTKYEKFKKTN